MADVNPFRRHLRAVPETAGSEMAGDRATSTVDPEGAAANRALTGAGRGDETAFGEFYDLTSSLVYGIVVRVVRDPAMAEEVAQEVFLELWRLAPRYREERGAARGWAATIAHRRAVDRVRSEQSRRQRDERHGRAAPVPFDAVTDEVEEALDRSTVRAALDTLTARQREAVELAYYGGNTYKEVAALLGVAEGTAKTRIRDGLVRLRSQFGARS